MAEKAVNEDTKRRIKVLFIAILPWDLKALRQAIHIFNYTDFSSANYQHTLIGKL